MAFWVLSTGDRLPHCHRGSRGEEWDQRISEQRKDADSLRNGEAKSNCAASMAAINLSVYSCGRPFLSADSRGCPAHAAPAARGFVSACCSGTAGTAELNCATGVSPVLCSASKMGEPAKCPLVSWGAPAWLTGAGGMVAAHGGQLQEELLERTTAPNPKLECRKEHGIGGSSKEGPWDSWHWACSIVSSQHGPARSQRVAGL